MNNEPEHIHVPDCPGCEAEDKAMASTGKSEVETKAEQFRLKVDSRWDEAISDAKRKLFEGKIYLTRLRAAIKGFEKYKANGVPWPETRKLEIKHYAKK